MPAKVRRWSEELPGFSGAAGSLAITGPLTATSALVTFIAAAGQSVSVEGSLDGTNWGLVGSGVVPVGGTGVVIYCDIVTTTMRGFIASGAVTSTHIEWLRPVDGGMPGGRKQRKIGEQTANLAIAPIPMLNGASFDQGVIAHASSGGQNVVVECSPNGVDGWCELYVFSELSQLEFHRMSVIATHMRVRRTADTGSFAHGYQYTRRVA